ncbi:SNF2 family domain-containing protein [Phlyctema vagabunda]|uniref:SNF2 family domain-containing protein n=1 Tax=Phlyctema vagabunda TaxID=108571 RepID=A0ABR4PYP0_9HELO
MVGAHATRAKGSRQSALPTAGRYGDQEHRNPGAAVSNPSSSGSLIADELPDNLINYVTQPDSSSEEPTPKRRKLTEQYVTIYRCSWNINCAGSKLSTVNGRARRDEVYCKISAQSRKRVGGAGGYVQIFDYPADKRLDDKQLSDKLLFILPFTDQEDLSEGVRFALSFFKIKWEESVQGKIWPAIGLELYHEQGFDKLQLVFDVRWDVTRYPWSIPLGTKRPQDLSQVFSFCFPEVCSPELNTLPEGKWSPQDFYQCVHTPDKHDPTAASLVVDEVKSALYPFQKRAVQWLLKREGVMWSDRQVRPLQDNTVNASALPLSFVQVSDVDGKPFYISSLYGVATRDTTPYKLNDSAMRGGILAEEMGLGKTLEMISLITLHKRPPDQQSMVWDRALEEQVRQTAATLIITPPVILQQWLDEINRHAPTLSVMHYKGIRAHDEKTPTELLDCLASSDIVLTTYPVLTAELMFTKANPTKTLRRQAKYFRPKSPLTQLCWWRIAIDEAQMIESGVSNAAVLARMLSRINAWCITGTPIKKDVGDLQGLLMFLRKEPFVSIKHVWHALTTTHKEDFKQLFGEIAMRHSKQAIRDELRLPAQRRYVITMPLTPIEEQYYQEQFSLMCQQINVDADGYPLNDGWDTDMPMIMENMRRWLVRLRQTANHPNVGLSNRRALGNREGPLRTIDEVLDVMMEQTDIAIRADQRSMFMNRLRKGQLLENSPRVKEALAIWDDVFKDATEIVQECRDLLQAEIASSSEDRNSRAGEVSEGSTLGSDEETDEQDPSSRVGVYRNRLRGSLEILHMATFFRANAYFQIKSNEDMTKPGSPEYDALEKLEADGYDSAKKLRQEILQEILRKANKHMRTIARRAGAQDFIQIPEFTMNPPTGGIESRRIMERLEELRIALDAQADQLDKWREQTIQFLLQSLVDEDDGLELTGEEYENSTRTQDEVMVYVQVLRATVTDRLAALNGHENKLTEQDVKVALRLAKDGEGAFPQKTLELLGTRAEIKPPKELGSLRGVVSELRTLATSLRLEAENGSNRSQNELSIVETQLKTVQKQFSEQTKSALALEKELELFTAVSNSRIEYYRQLQEVSDMVIPWEEPDNEDAFQRLVQDEGRLVQKVATSKAKRRYLLHLRDESANPNEPRFCVICRETFDVGALTVCGHMYCRNCIKEWWSSHRTCPICKKHLILADMHDVTYKPQKLSIETEDILANPQEGMASSTLSKKSAIYSEFSKAKLAEIKNIDLGGPSSTTKVDTLARHLIWLREADPGAKSVIFSQFKDFLDVLGHAFERYRIGYSTFDKPNGIQKFKEDGGVECFLLHARAHSSGLNLVNANHVFLCEPLLNTALELQAIARVDRIGQHQETNVWQYIIQDTVEESIHQLSVKRRMEHIDQSLLIGKGKSRATSPAELLDSNLDAANSLELQQAMLKKILPRDGIAGEMVENEDLWSCLFGGVGERRKSRLLQSQKARHDPEVRRHLGAEAAESRR